MSDLAQYIRPSVRRLKAYVPGEQPRVRGLVKLNTNENPHPPSPKVLRAITQAAGTRLRLYPNPTAQPLRERLARLHGCPQEHIIIGNGSDELLALATRAFVEPLGLPAVSPPGRPGTKARSTRTIQFFDPSYSLYPVLANIHHARPNPVALRSDFNLPSVTELRAQGKWDFHAALSFVTTPNAPSGRGYPTSQLEKLCRAQRGVVILDEAYADFAEENALELAARYPQVIVSRTFSKSYSLCFQRVGYFVGNPELIRALDRIRDSYNVNGLGQAAAVATLTDLPYYRRCFRQIIGQREQTSSALTQLGFEVCPSQTNFLFVRPPRFSAEKWFEQLREKKILVRWFSAPKVRDKLRITIGNEQEMRRLVRAARQLLSR